MASLVVQLVENLLAMRETWVQSLGWEDPLEKGKATHSSILAQRIPWTVLSMGLQRVRHDWATFTHKTRLWTRLWALRQPAWYNIKICVLHEKMSTSLIIRETLIKTTMRYHLTRVRTAIIKKSTNNKWWKECGKSERSYTVAENANWSSHYGGFFKN